MAPSSVSYEGHPGTLRREPSQAIPPQGTLGRHPAHDWQPMLPVVGGKRGTDGSIAVFSRGWLACSGLKPGGSAITLCQFDGVRNRPRYEHYREPGSYWGKTGANWLNCKEDAAREDFRKKRVIDDGRSRAAEVLKRTEDFPPFFFCFASGYF